MNLNVDVIKTISWKGAIGLASVIFIAGCSSAKVDSRPAGSAKLPNQAPVPQPPVDQSWTSEAYVRIGMPDPDRFWTAAEFRDCRDVLYGLALTNRNALPRVGSSKSGAVFGRLTSATNTLFLGEAHLPSEERIRNFMAILNRLPVFQDIYRMDSRQSDYCRELIELDHALLRMLGSAVEWDGKRLPPSAGESEPVTFRLVEVSRSYRDSLVNRNPADNVIPRGDRLVIVGALASATLSSILPWLADGTGLSDADRVRAIRYFREDTPILWPHLSSDHQREVVGILDAVMQRTTHEEIRRDIEAFRRELTSKESRAPH